MRALNELLVEEVGVNVALVFAGSVGGVVDARAANDAFVLEDLHLLVALGQAGVVVEHVARLV